MPLPATFDLMDFIRRTLGEDLGQGGDVTSKATIAEDARFSAEMNARQEIIVAGLEIAAGFFRAIDGNVRIEQLIEDGARVHVGTVLMRLEGNARAMLAAERSALNTLQHLSGIATMTRTYVDAIAGTGATLLDTRKTIPGLRSLEKYAARMGGAQNHRMRLDDGVLIKDNHVAVCGGVTEAVRRAKSANTGLQVQVESTGSTRSSRRSPRAPTGCCSTIWPPRASRGGGLVAGRVPLEASGGVTLETIRSIAETGCRLHLGRRITQSAPAVDIGLDYFFRLIVRYPKRCSPCRQVAGSNESASRRVGRAFTCADASRIEE
jgi:nicotinate-nucleotide pyrophosphorylase (carboxylating)